MRCGPKPLNEGQGSYNNSTDLLSPTLRSKDATQAPPEARRIWITPTRALIARGFALTVALTVRSGHGMTESAGMGPSTRLVRARRGDSIPVVSADGKATIAPLELSGLGAERRRSQTPQTRDPVRIAAVTSPFGKHGNMDVVLISGIEFGDVVRRHSVQVI